MNKKIKSLIAITLIISGFLTFEPAGYLNLTTTKAYAASYSLADKGELTSLEINTTDGKNLQLCDDYDGDNKPLTDGKEYYVTMDDTSDGLKILASVGEGYVVKVFESDRDNATGHDLEDNISIKKGTTNFYLRTYTSENSYKKAQEDEEVTNCSKTYKVNVKKVSTKSEDNIYLRDIKLNGGNMSIDFNRDIYSYNIVVSQGDYDITINAIPEYDKYTVKIGGFEVTKDDKYRKTISLKNGKTEIKINITDGNDKNRTYTLNIIKGGISNTETNTINNTTKETTMKYNQWVRVNDKWQYNDSTGSFIKNTWFYDKNFNKNYYLQGDGNIATGWISNNGQWYYLDESGARQSGWLSKNGEWYYLDSNGVMQTGWIKDLNGKYYYLQSNGVMAKNTKINGFKLGNDGDWVK